MEPNNSVIDANPKPDFLIKSVAEQGYNLESAISDLINNSVSAKAKTIQVLVDSDNGEGMSRSELTNNVQFPSTNLESQCKSLNLGRLGLEIKAD